jgi:enoyl-CoA hydratase
MSEENVVLLTHEGPISTLTVNRPEVLNALNADVLKALRAATTEMSRRHEARCLVVTGAGEKAFVAGADIAGMRTMTVAEANAFSSLGHEVMATFEALEIPVIAAVNGFALGGGCELALSCDFIYASEKAKFGQPEVNLGVIPGFGGTQRLARRVGISAARELIYTGAIIDAQEALRIRLVNKVFPADQLLAEATKTAQAIASKGPVAVAHAKRVIAEGLDNVLSDGNAIEVEAFAKCFSTDDQKEGMNAFVEKRPAAFRGC